MKIVRLALGTMGTNCYLLADSGEVAVIDPGFEPGVILAELKKLGGRVKYIINTHGHIDHMGANAAIKQATSAEIVIGRKDAEHLTNAQSNLSAFMGGSITSPPANLLVQEGDAIKVGKVVMKVMDAPGHTEGGICLIGDGFVFTGDTMFFASIGRTDFPGGSEKQIIASLRRLVEVLPDNTMVYPGHEEPGLMRAVKRANPFLFYGE
jgi:glyoxylase-like metal-dependent hydrolase (beta-lactamase superfamily II)